MHKDKARNRVVLSALPVVGERSYWVEAVPEGAVDW